MYVSYKEWGLSVPSIIASVIGTHFAARRVQFSFKYPFITLKKRGEHKRRTRSPFTNA